MSNIDKQQIRADIAIRKSMPGFGVSPDHNLARLKAIQETQRSFGLDVVETLLDELEAVNELFMRAKALMYQSGGTPIENSLNPIDAWLYDAERAAAAGKGE
ncbi:hypothetical protein LMJ45_14195 [Enterobacter cloacae]|uniref:hypothetical protein n=1 Tax=Enterobacter cloacae TaxID=550 RepID=UPI001E5F60A2|nr:hypothetical protein [Enterobacter cloacae]UER82175.1 hypothetical protein LMJ45_14195 [Enterobacter cloacae]